MLAKSDALGMSCGRVVAVSGLNFCGHFSHNLVSPSEQDFCRLKKVVTSRSRYDDATGDATKSTDIILLAKFSYHLVFSGPYAV